MSLQLDSLLLLFDRSERVAIAKARAFLKNTGQIKVSKYCSVNFYCFVMIFIGR